MNTVEHIKSEIERLYKTDPNVLVSVNMKRPKLIIERAPAKIVGVYKNIFRIEECGTGLPTRHTLQYSDVLIGQVVIEKLEDRRS